jgi:hypothetical protein
LIGEGCCKYLQQASLQKLEQKWEREDNGRDGRNLSIITVGQE